MLPTLGVAFSDVVIDALMVEKGQPLGLTGVLQSAQWTAMYAGTIVAGLLGGYLSQNNQQEAAFLICAVDHLHDAGADLVLRPGTAAAAGNSRGCRKR